MNTTDFLNLLKNHDWTYHYSDDHRVYTRGMRNEQLIMSTMQGRDDLQELYNKYRGGKK